MNDEKQSTGTLAEALARDHNLSKTAASTFIKQLTAAFAEGLLQDGELRIKGLGLFKIEWVENRISANEQNGKKQAISGHNKISFIPDKTLRDKVNAPFAHLETIALDETEETNADAWLDDEEQRMKRFSEQAKEILSIISDLQEINSPTIHEPTTPSNETVKTIDAAQTENKPKEIVSEVINTPPSTDKPLQQPSLKAELPNETLQENASQPVQSLDPKEEFRLLERMAEQAPKKNKRWMAISIIVALIVVICIPIYYVLFLANHSQSSVTSATQINQSTTGFKQTENPVKIMNATTAKPSPAAVADPLSQPRTYKDTLAVVTFKEGSRLTLLSLKYYGNKLFWVYIYEANKNKITNPDDIGAGTRLMIPRLNPKLIDATNPQCLNQANALQVKYTHHSFPIK
jgi:nucleoid DNA-binding protein/nucleoid-associated protein YgaU